ncbi:hypothetical protein TNCV_2205591 [Trichonephila clavipes]|nr:hypothetical protein TNCV_2205591 [Trichonephila clavipes]
MLAPPCIAPPGGAPQFEKHWAKPMGNRPRGRPTTPFKWIDCVEKDLNILKVKKWKTVAKSRDAWRKLLEKWLVTLTVVPFCLGSDPGEGMDICKCIVPSRHGGTLNSRRAASPLVRFVEGEEK